MKKKLLMLSTILCISVSGYSQVIQTINSLDSIKKIKDVIQLDLSHKNLITIPKEVFELTNLKSLDLTGNNITTIPADIKKLKSLEVLKLDSNAITSFSSDVLNLKNLREVSISDDVIGKQTALQAAIYLNNIGDYETSKAILEESKNNVLTNLADMKATKLPIWKGTTHSIGFVTPNNNTTLITDATKVTADPLLKNSAVKLTLDLVYVEDYPGKGKHRILIEFSGKNQISDTEKEQVNYALTRSVQEGQFAGLKSVPMVVGLNIGKEGVEFQCATINVKNENDEKLMAILDSDVASDGLKLLNSVNPVIPIVSNLVSGIGKQFLTRNNNVKVQDFTIGLDFGASALKGKLAQGSYIIAQTGDDPFNWSDWEISSNNGTVVSKANPAKKLPYNYLVFSISKVND